MGINAGIKFFTSVIHHKSPALTTFIRCLQGTPLFSSFIPLVITITPRFKFLGIRSRPLATIH
ncbi:hypothetical protein FNN84_23340 [Salmonella enterica subsp. salamae]|uniref:Uncharacterized protein n=1 Tax=Salmonella enterica subsp. salamae TaxID=59202 RepID=A0A5Y2S931_SALER|nr:hypothetical protein [Salmonella enterica subsp. salamae]ECJ2314650.1 hypothetical protein [Salmonella enterica subsp. salamae]